MYVIEKIIKLYLNITKKKQKIITADFDDNYILEDIVTCKHNFMPIDSTGETLACSKCGFVKSKKSLDKK